MLSYIISFLLKGPQHNNEQKMGNTGDMGTGELLFSTSARKQRTGEDSMKLFPVWVPSASGPQKTTTMGPKPSAHSSSKSSITSATAPHAVSRRPITGTASRTPKHLAPWRSTMSSHSTMPPVGDRAPLRKPKSLSLGTSIITCQCSIGRCSMASQVPSANRFRKISLKPHGNLSRSAD